MDRTNKLFMIWGIIVVAIVALLTVLGFSLKKTEKIYSVLEKELVEKAEKYVDVKALYPKDDGFTTKVTLKELKENEYIEELKIDDDVCDGYVIVSKDMVFKYKAYIKCNKYTTNGYEE
ncbi:MAG: hypothetical protein K2J20_00750 [Bacilli bacterium]|nr:hypothetical protein [Bacilli bacterium]